MSGSRIRIKSYIKDFWESCCSFFFPAYCIDCHKRIVANYRHICPKCFDKLPKYEGMEAYYKPGERVAGLIPYNEVETDLIFSERSVVRELIHLIKFKGFPELGYKLSKHFAQRHLAAGHFSDISIIIPIPITKSRYRKRGYNQSTFIAEGLGEILGIPVRTDILKRKGHGSQTARDRYERWDAMKDQFIADPNKAKHKRVLIVDDVMTSGATMVHAARVLYQDGGVESVSLYTLALDIYL